MPWPARRNWPWSGRRRKGDNGDWCYVMGRWLLVFLYEKWNFVEVGHFPYHGDDVDQPSDEVRFG